MAKSVFCIVPSYGQATKIVGQLEAAGFSPNDISVLMPDRSGTRDFAHEHNTKAPEGAVAGAGTGGVLGGTVGLLAGIGALAIPGVGPFLAAGPIMAALSGAAVGATVGGIAGALVGLGIPEDEATGAAAVRITTQLERALTIVQGRGSVIHARWLGGDVEVGGRVVLDRSLRL